MRAIYLLLIALAAPLIMAESIEEPPFTALGSVNGVELRRYAPSIQARTPLAHSGQTSLGFRRLAGFIFGGNDRDMEIAMTAPVEETLEPEPTMAFTMPSRYRMEDLPLPDDGKVELVELPVRTVAVLAFSGWATTGRVAARTEQLLETLQALGIAVVGPPSLNQYNPPWTPPFMRRNEIMVGIGAIPPGILEGDHAGS
jgi:hypothetical protein